MVLLSPEPFLFGDLQDVHLAVGIIDGRRCRGALVGGFIHCAAALREHHDVAGFIIAIVSVIYAVLLALVVVAVWEDFGAARETTESEANELATVFRLAHGLPAPLQTQIRGQATLYARAVVDEEWSAMSRGQTSPRAVAALNELWEEYEEWEPRTPRQNVIYQESLDALRELSNDRRHRLLESRDGIPGLMWVVLVFGGAVTIIFTYFFGIENQRVQALMTTLLAAEIGLVLFLISALNYAFNGDLQVRPEAFDNVLQDMSKIERHEKLIGAQLPANNP